MNPQVVTVGPLAAASTNNIALAQAVASATTLVLNGSTVVSGVAILDVARRVLITSAADDTDITFRVTGTNAFGNPIRETIVGANGGTVFTGTDFKTVTEIRTSAAASGNVTVGTNAVASSPWMFTTYHIAPVNISIGVVVTGTVNCTIEYTYDNPNSNQNVIGSQGQGNYPAVPNTWSHATLVSMTASEDGFINDPIFAWRLVVNTGAVTTSSVTATAIQAGISNSR